ncbi:MAG: rRNA maturation RNase YbeY [Nitratireductor sp.]|nr:rRNA maturation RNase YbeY [Nitratireductor sp.]
MLPLIDIDIRCQGWPDETDLLQSVNASIAAAIAAAGLEFADAAELSMVFTDDTDMQAINRQWRGMDKPTNVLSFPADDIRPGDAAGAMLGDIVLALETVRREASLEDKQFDHHLRHLVIHGLLHLFGYDHMNDDEARIMESLERDALARMGIGDPYAGEA